MPRCKLTDNNVLRCCEPSKLHYVWGEMAYLNTTFILDSMFAQNLHNIKYISEKNGKTAVPVAY